MDVLINGIKRPLRFGVRFELEIEQKMGKTFGQMQNITTKETIQMFYIALEVGAKKAGTTLDFSIEELIDAIDDNGKMMKTFEEAMVKAYVVPKG